MSSAYLQWRFHSGERVVARGPLFLKICNSPFFYLFMCPADCLTNSVDPDQMPSAVVSAPALYTV